MGLLIILGLFLAFNVYLLISGRFYIYRGMKHTYLKGRLGPSIYDLNVFPYSTMKKGDANFQWMDHPQKNNQNVPEDLVKLHAKLKTKAFLIIRNDEVLFEQYFDEHSKDLVSNSFSAAKTIVALLIGIAIEEGKIDNLDQSVSDFIPEFNTDEKRDITIRHLLLMASGLDWAESSKNPFSHNAESYFGLDLYSLVNRQNVIREPGKDFYYQSGNSQLLGFIIKKATGKSVSMYLEEKIWKHIGPEKDAHWSLDREGGNEKSFCCFYATARDFARIGRLIMHNGNWDGKQLVPEWYLKEMKNPQHHMGTEYGVPNHQYGLHLWHYEGYGKMVNYCRGILGQYIITVPDEDLIIVRLGSKRELNYAAPLKEDELEEKISLVGHPKDFPKYFNFAKNIEAQTP